MTLARPQVYVVAGPTASGKSAFAEALALRLGGQVVNADSVQLYGAFRVLTARPSPSSPAAERRLPHLLYGILGPLELCSAGRWRALALEAIATGHAEGRPSVVVGGSGLYLDALLRGFAPIPPITAAVRREALRCLEDLGPEGLHARLGDVDPELAERLPPSDRQRIARGWEVWLATGRPLSAWQADVPAPTGLDPCRILLRPPRAAVRAAIEIRVGRMLAAGALEEVRAFAELDVPADAPVRKAHGLRAFTRHLRGDITLAEARELTVNETRQYAKRQDTWFRRRYAEDHLLEHAPDVIAAEAETLAREVAPRAAREGLP